MFVEHSLQFGDVLSGGSEALLILPLCYPENYIQIFLGVGIEANEDFPKIVGAVSRGKVSQLSLFDDYHLFEEGQQMFLKVMKHGLVFPLRDHQLRCFTLRAVGEGLESVLFG